MKKRTKINILFSSLAAIFLAGSVLAGGTYALFTSESKTNIAVTSGTVKVEAVASDLWLYSPKLISTDEGNPIVDDHNMATTADNKLSGTFYNGGTATLDPSEGIVSLNKMTPGDYATFKITVTNKSDVKTKYRTIIKKIDPTDDYLYSALDISIGGLRPEYYSKWQTLNAASPETGETIVTHNCKIELPTTVSGTEYMNKECNILVYVEAVQYNAQTSDEEATTTETQTIDASSDATLMDGDTKKESTVVAEVPAGSTDATSLTLVKTPTEVPGNIEIETGSTAISTDVKLIDQDGNKVVAKNDKFFTITVQLEKYLQVLKFYHNSTELTLVDSVEDLNDANLYFYNVETGKVYFTTTEFSVFTAKIKFSGGLGTEEAPYLISTSDDWAGINNETQSEDKHYKQTADLVANIYITKFMGVYDGGHYKLTASYLFTNMNYASLFYETIGHVSLKNINVTMSTFPVNLLRFADWRTGYGADFENIIFTGVISNSATANNFGLIVADALFTSGDDTVTYNFKNITNYVSIENTGAALGFINGSGPCFNAKTILNYENCKNYGDFIGTSYVGYLYGNPTYVNQGCISKTGSEINVKNCENTGTFHATKTDGLSAFALGNKDVSTLNETYQDSIGGTYISGPGALDDLTIEIHQNDTSFYLSGVSDLEGYTYKLAFSISSTYHTVDGEAWTDSDLKELADNNYKADAITWNVASGTKYFHNLGVDESATSGHTKFHAYDKRTAKSKGFDVESLTFTDKYALVVKDDTTYVILDIGDNQYVDSSVSLIVYAYKDGVLSGTKTVK